MRQRARLPAVMVGLALLLPLSATPVAASTFTAACGFNQNGNNVRSTAWTDTSVQVPNIYVHSEFYRDGAFINNFNDDGVNRSHAQKESGWNYSFPWEHPTYRVKSWHNIRDHNLWHTVKFCDVSWTKP